MRAAPPPRGRPPRWAPRPTAKPSSTPPAPRSPTRSPPRRPDGSSGVGVASMAESGVLLADDGRAVAPLIAWHDTRDAAETAALRAELGAQFSVRTGLPLRQQWSLTKHRWQLDHDEAAAAGVRRLGVAEWIVHALGGEQVSEQSLASRTGWLDLRPPRLVGRGAGVERRPAFPAARAGGLRRTGRDRARPLGHPRPRRRRADRRRARPPGRGHRRRRRPGARRARFLRHRRGFRAHGAARAGPRRHPRPHRRGDHRRLARPARALVPARRDPRRPRPAARPGPARAGTRRPPGARRRRPARRTRRADRHRRRRVTGRPARRSATTSTRPGSGGPPSPPRSTPVGTSTTP